MTPGQLLEQLVAMPSVSSEEKAIADFLQDLAASWGADVQRQGNNLWFGVGSGSPNLLLNSHLDTVPPCAGWSSDPFVPRWQGERMTGLGANDAKGCVAALLCTAKALLESGLPDGRVTFALTAEEETGGQGLGSILEQLGPLDAAVVGEPTGLRVCAAQRGMLLLRCTAKGHSGHVAHAQMLGALNAIHAAARDIARIEAMSFPAHPLLGATKAQVTQVQGGLRRNQVPDACEFFVDLRTAPEQEHGAVAEAFAAALDSEVAVHSARYLPKATDPQHPIVRAALTAAGKVGPVGSATTSDWAFLGDLPAVKAGPGDTFRSHRPDEFITLAELGAGVAFYQRLVPAFLREAVHVH
ncbi:MAG TPA: M20/M25/M40 family metallo-hydrolase [Holophagaceae bacterium]|nr:M20/M25/M40 family metallo-hydrolase [Holophagaceae bacterium]